MTIMEAEDEEMVGTVFSTRSIHQLAAVEAEDYDSEDLEGCETVPTIELSEDAALSDLECQADDYNNNNNDDNMMKRMDDDLEAQQQQHRRQQEQQSGSTTAATTPTDEPVAVPLGSVLSTGGMENEFNTNKSSRRFQKRAEFISANIIKPTKRSDVGLSFSKLIDGGTGLCIADIKRKGLLFESGCPIEIGDRVISINNQSCCGDGDCDGDGDNESFSMMDPKRATKLIRDAKNSVTIVVQNVGGDPLMVECMITKPSPGHRTGIGFSSSETPTSTPQVNISSIFVEGLFADSLLTEGDEVITVNDIPVRELDSNTVADIVIAAPRFVTITAKKFQGNGVVVACDDIDKKKRKRRSTSSITNTRGGGNSSSVMNERRTRKPIMAIQLILFGVFLSCVIVIILFVVVAPMVDT